MINKIELLKLMSKKSKTKATIQFYDMADRYILFIGDIEIAMKEDEALSLIHDIENSHFAKIFIKNNHVAAVIDTKKTNV